MKRSLTLILTALALASGLADAGRRSSGGGFGGSRSSGSSSGSTYRAPTPQYTPPRTNSSAGSTYTSPRTSTRPSTPAAPKLPSTAAVRSNPLNRAAAAKVTPAQLSGWKNVALPAGVPRRAITYSAAKSSQYQYQLQPGRFYPYPQSYYRSRGIGYDILKYAVIFMAVDSMADAMRPDDVVNNTNPANMGTVHTGTGDLSDVPAGPVVAQQKQGPTLWTYVGVGFFAAAAAWFTMGRRRKPDQHLRQPGR